MLQINISTIDKKALFQKLDEEKERLEQIARKKALQKKLLNEFDIRFFHLDQLPENNLQKQDIRIASKDTYDISELLYFSDLDFIKNCYRAILGREPDAGGINHYIDKLRRGKLHKIDIIGRMSLTKEARVHNIRIKGLWPKFVLRTFFTIPILGYILQYIIAILRLPTIVKRNEQLENHIAQLIAQENHQIYQKLLLLQQNDNKIIEKTNSNIQMLENGLGNMIAEIKKETNEGMEKDD